MENLLPPCLGIKRNWTTCFLTCELCYCHVLSSCWLLMVLAYMLLAICLQMCGFFFFFYNEIHFLIFIFRDWYVKKRCRRIAEKMLFISFRETKGYQSSVNFMLYDFGIIALGLFYTFFFLDS